MNFLGFALQHAGQTLLRHVWLFLFLAGAHLAANATFTAFVSYAFGILFFGSPVQPEMVGWIANAPLTASLAVIVTSVTFGQPCRTGQRRSFHSLLPLESRRTACQ